MSPTTNNPAISTVIEHSLVRCGIEELLDLLKGPSRSTCPAVAARFDWLMKVAESSPLTTTEFGFALNWITSARRLWEQGERGAAHYQVKMVRKKLEL